MKRAAVFLALAAAGAQAWAQPAARIELLPQVQVEGDRVLLGEVAHLQSNDLATMRELVQLPLGAAPRAGEAAVVRRETLAQWIRRRSSVDPARLQWVGADDTRVVRASQHVEGERVAGAAVAALRAWLQEHGASADVQVRRPPRDFDLPAGELRLQARRPDISARREHMHLWVDLFVAGRLARSVPVLLDLQRLTGPRLQAAATVAPLPAPEAGRMPLPPVVVTRGDWAALHTTSGAVSLVSRVEVLQDGRVGDKVRVRTRGATGLVLARVLAAGRLELAP